MPAQSRRGLDRCQKFSPLAKESLQGAARGRFDEQLRAFEIGPPRHAHRHRVVEHHVGVRGGVRPGTRRRQEGERVGELRRFGAQHGLVGVGRKAGLLALLQLRVGEGWVVVADERRVERVFGELRLDQHFAGQLGAPGVDFTVGDEHWRFRAQAYVVLHKPAGYECSQKPTFHPSVFTLLPPQLLLRGVQCVGRLDQDTTGLLLLSDDGQFIHQWSSGKKRTPKVYEVTLKHAVEQEFAERMVAGVELHDEPEPIAAAACELTSPTTLRLTICEGKYHQVKRMVAAAGNRVEVLHRSRVGGLDLPPELAPGQWRWLEAEDLARLADFVSPEAL